MTYMPIQQKPAKAAGSTGVLVGIIMMVALPIIGFVAILIAALAAPSPVIDAVDYSSDGQPAQIKVSELAPIGIWVDQLGQASGHDCSVVNPFDQPVALESPTDSRDAEGYHQVAVFSPRATGTYLVSCQSDGTAFNFRVMATGQTGDASTFAVGAGLVVLVLGFLVGVVVLVVSLIRRANWNRHHRPSFDSAAMYVPTAMAAGPGATAPVQSYGPGATAPVPSNGPGVPMSQAY
ncbi:MAG: hypothetical protein LBV30_07460, partial [Propionibacteriaceae bacterium]|nr:hypothetical protein [Propionibacteriaceae bacterium]